MKAPTLSSTAAAFILPLSERTRANVIKVWPAASMDDIAQAAEDYQVARAGYAEQANPTEIGNAIPSLLGLAEHLISAIEIPLDCTIEEEAKGRRVREFFDYAARSAGNPSVDNFEWQLRTFHATLLHAQQLRPRGRRAHPRQGLVIALAAILERAGIEVDARSSGPLYQVVDILLNEHLSESAKDVRSIVEAALSERNL